MTYVIYGVIAALSTSLFYRLGALIRGQIPGQFLFIVGIIGVMGLQMIVISGVLVLHMLELIGGNKFLNLALSIPVSVGFGLGIFRGLNQPKK